MSKFNKVVSELIGIVRLNWQCKNCDYVSEKEFRICPRCGAPYR